VASQDDPKAQLDDDEMEARVVVGESFDAVGIDGHDVWPPRMAHKRRERRIPQQKAHVEVGRREPFGAPIRRFEQGR
jgi:hypothetical protein